MVYYFHLDCLDAEPSIGTFSVVFFLLFWAIISYRLQQKFHSAVIGIITFMLYIGHIPEDILSAYTKTCYNYVTSVIILHLFETSYLNIAVTLRIPYFHMSIILMSCAITVMSDLCNSRNHIYLSAIISIPIVQ